MESAGDIPGFSKFKGRGIVSAEADTGSPLRGDFERMARRRFQYPTPRRRGDWWTIQVRQDVFVDGKFKLSNKRVRLAPATMPEREVRKKLTIAANLPGLRPYDCRHIAITNLLQNPDVSEETVKAIAGHVSLEILKTYSHICLEAKQAALDALVRKSFKGKPQ